MSYATRFYGKLTIEPPLNWKEIKQSEAWEGHPDHRSGNGSASIFSRRYGIRLVMVTRKTETDEGVTIQRTCNEVEVVGEELRADEVLDQLRQLASQFGAAHTFHGWFDAQGERADDTSKIKIVGTEVVQERPVPLWPGDGAALAVVAATLVNRGDWESGEAVTFAGRILGDLHDALSGGRS